MPQIHQPVQRGTSRLCDHDAQNQARRKNRRFPFGRAVAVLLILSILLALSGCAGDNLQPSATADYGRYGANLASQVAAAWPNRSAGSMQETETGNYLINELKAMGYSPDVATFSFSDRSGVYRSSRNISITVEGLGFLTEPEEDKPAETLDRQVVIGAHYDTWFSAEDIRSLESTEATVETTAELAAGIAPEPEAGDYDGIHDNASGIGVLMTLARLLRQEKLGYDVVLVAFGAGESAQAGANAFVADMTDADIRRTDVMYCIDSIYAGDKVYAHSGRNSLIGGFRKDYEKRRKLYEVTDVFYENELYTNNNYMLYTNQASFDVTLPGKPSRYIYREWSLTDSDYLPFDELGIPIVFFESFNYDGRSLVDLKESSSPVFSTTQGAIRHTFYDSSLFLKKHYSQVEQSRETEETETSATIETVASETTEGTDEESGTQTEPDEPTLTPTPQVSPEPEMTTASESDDEPDPTVESEAKKVIDLLTKRVNNTAFIILEAIKKGIPDTTVKPARP